MKSNACAGMPAQHSFSSSGAGRIRRLLVGNCGGELSFGFQFCLSGDCGGNGSNPRFIGLAALALGQNTNRHPLLATFWSRQASFAPGNCAPMTDSAARLLAVRQEIERACRVAKRDPASVTLVCGSQDLRGRCHRACHLGRPAGVWRKSGEGGQGQVAGAQIDEKPIPLETATTLKEVRSVAVQQSPGAGAHFSHSHPAQRSIADRRPRYASRRPRSHAR